MIKYKTWIQKMHIMHYRMLTFWSQEMYLCPFLIAKVHGYLNDYIYEIFSVSFMCFDYYVLIVKYLSFFFFIMLLNLASKISSLLIFSPNINQHFLTTINYHWGFNFKLPLSETFFQIQMRITSSDQPSYTFSSPSSLIFVVCG